MGTVTRTGTRTHNPPSKSRLASRGRVPPRPIWYAAPDQRLLHTRQSPAGVGRLADVADMLGVPELLLRRWRWRVWTRAQRFGRSELFIARRRLRERVDFFGDGDMRRAGEALRRDVVEKFLAQLAEVARDFAYLRDYLAPEAAARLLRDHDRAFDPEEYLTFGEALNRDILGREVTHPLPVFLRWPAAVLADHSAGEGGGDSPREPRRSSGHGSLRRSRIGRVGSPRWPGTAPCMPVAGCVVSSAVRVAARIPRGSTRYRLLRLGDASSSALSRGDRGAGPPSSASNSPNSSASRR